MRTVRWWGAAACLWALACSDSSGPSGGVPTSGLLFLEQAVAAPPLAAYQVKFWAVRGSSRKGELFYSNGDRFLELNVQSGSLLRRPDGTAFAPGDSILITVTVDSVRFIAKFDPEGLVFDPREPADLEIEYDKADSLFIQREAEIEAWRQERAGEPWQAVPFLRFDDLDDIDIEVPGFTRYALAIG